MKEKTLVITGMGAVTPIGIGVAAYWEALKAGRCGGKCVPACWRLGWFLWCEATRPRCGR